MVLAVVADRRALRESHGVGVGWCVVLVSSVISLCWLRYLLLCWLAQSGYCCVQEN